MEYLEFLVKRFWGYIVFFLLSLGLVCSCNDEYYRNVKEGYYTKHNVACIIKYAEIDSEGYHILGLYAKGKTFRESVTTETYYSCKDRIGETVHFSLSDNDIGLKDMSILFPLGIMSAVMFLFLSPIRFIDPQEYISESDKTYLKYGKITVIILDLTLVFVGLGLFLYSNSLI